jgi:hypothetical protein
MLFETGIFFVKMPAFFSLVPFVYLDTGFNPNICQGMEGGKPSEENFTGGRQHWAEQSVQLQQQQQQQQRKSSLTGQHCSHPH